MLRLDNNKYIQIIYNKSRELHEYHETRTKNDDEGEPEDVNSQPHYKHISNKFKSEAQQNNNAVYGDLKLHKAEDIYIFEKDINPNNLYLTHQEEYMLYPRRDSLLQAISKAMLFQDENNLIDFHPTVDSLTGDMKKQVDQEMKGKAKTAAKIRNIIHQSTQSYHKALCSQESTFKIELYFSEMSERSFKYDQWGKIPQLSPSHFLWIPARFVFDTETEQYKCEGKLFEHLEKWSDIPELKSEISALVTYFAPGLKIMHEHFKDVSYLLYNRYDDLKVDEHIEIKNQVNFDDEIRAIVKISEIEIEPHSVYSGQWHVEGFSSDNVLYTCLYVIEQDEKLVNGKIKFKRAVRDDDAPPNAGSQPQSAHDYCPDYEYLCDKNKLIPLGSLDIKQNLMIIFPNQNIHKVKGITNNTDLPLKRKIVALFVVNHVDQPYSLDDLSFTASLRKIKAYRQKDMYERSKNKQTDTQSFNYCEH